MELLPDRIKRLKTEDKLTDFEEIVVELLNKIAIGLRNG